MGLAVELGVDECVSTAFPGVVVGTSVAAASKPVYQYFGHGLSARKTEHVRDTTPLEPTELEAEGDEESVALLKAASSDRLCQSQVTQESLTDTSGLIMTRRLCSPPNTRSKTSARRA